MWWRPHPHAAIDMSRFSSITFSRTAPYELAVYNLAESTTINRMQLPTNNQGMETEKQTLQLILKVRLFFFYGSNAVYGFEGDTHTVPGIYLEHR